MQNRLILVTSLVIFFLISSGIARDLPETINRKYDVTGKSLRVEIRMDAGEFTLSRSNEANTVWVHIGYNPDRCEVHISYDEEDQQFYLNVDHNNIFNKDSNDEIAKVHVELPAEPVTDLDAKIKAGELKFHLGDISLQNCKIKSYAGELSVDFDAPNRIEMDDLDINCSIGETTLDRIGYARFHRAWINSGIGEMSVDFTGWSGGKGRADLDNDLGEMSVFIPQDTPVRMRVSKAGFLTDYHYSDRFVKRGRYLYSKNHSGKGEGLDLHISSGIGALAIDTE